MTNVMEKIVEQGFLYDFYGPLLTARQQEIYEACVYEDLSLSEAAERFSVSRQAVHDLLKRCDATLREYEEKLGLIGRFRSRDKELTELRARIAAGRKADGSSDFDAKETKAILELLDQLQDEG